MRIWLPWVLVLAVSIGGGCDSSPVGPYVDSLDFQLGQRWIYAFESETRDSAGSVIDSYRDSLEVRVASVNDTLFGLAGLIRMEVRSLIPWAGPGPAPDVQTVWYAVTDRDVVEHAYRNPAATAIVQLSAAGLRAPRRRWSFFDPLGDVMMEAIGDSIQKREDPRKVLLLPLAIGASWDSFRLPFYQRREVLDIEAIDVLGRGMQVAKIRTTVPDLIPDLEWYDWVSGMGLMRRSIRMSAVWTDENMNVLGEVTHTETTILMAMS